MSLKEDKYVSPYSKKPFINCKNTNNENFWSNIQSFYQKSLFCDVELICYKENEKRSILCHKLILSSISSFFRKILLSTKNSDAPCVIYFNDYEYQNMKCIIDNIYKALSNPGSFTSIQGKLKNLAESREFLMI